MRCCSAAVPSAEILNSASTSASSASAFSTPRRAIVQKSAELLVTNASLIVFAPSPPGLPARHPAIAITNTTTTANLAASSESGWAAAVRGHRGREKRDSPHFPGSFRRWKRGLSPFPVDTNLCHGPLGCDFIGSYSSRSHLDRVRTERHHAR